MGKRLRKPKQESKKKFEMKVEKAVCYIKIDSPPEEEDYSFHFIPSGFKGSWLKVWECYDYMVGVEYASPEENEILNREK